MAVLHGKGGAINWAGTGVDPTEIQSWSVDATGDVAETTAMADTWKGYLGGFKDWTATIEYNFDNAVVPTALLATDLAGAAAVLTLYFVAAGANVYGSAILTGLSATTDKDDVCKMTATFQGSGALAYAAA